MTEEVEASGGADGADETAVRTSEEGLLPVVSALLKALNQQGASPSFKKKELADKLGIKDSRLNSLQNPSPQNLKSIKLDELDKVVVFARQVAREVTDLPRREMINGYCNEIARRLHFRFDGGGLNVTENSLVMNLNLIDDRKQQEFSDRHAGVYAVIRIDRDAHVIVSRMDLRPKTDQLCRFATESPGFSELRVEGFIYAAGDVIQSVGRPAGKNWLRTTILKPCANAEQEEVDMIGLRLGLSDLDGGAFGYRVYAKQICGPELVGKPMPDPWPSLFGTSGLGEIDALKPKITDIEQIVNLLQEKTDATPWGVRSPIEMRKSGQ